MANRLFDYQLEAVRKMKNGCILCGGVGSGKSRTAIAYYYLQNGGSYNSLAGDNYVPMKDHPSDLYIITTARKRDTVEWEKEFAPFLLSSDLYHHIIVIDSWNNIKKYSNITNSFFIFDEQRVIGSGTWVKAFLKITRKNKWILLSATPGDSWKDYIPVFVANGFYKNKTDFSQQHIVYSNFSKYPKIDHYYNTGTLLRHRNDILVTMDYRRDTISHHEDVYVTYDKMMYKDASRLRWDPFENKPVENASGMCLIYRKIVNSDESRQVALLTIFEKHPKIIVFYTFDYELEILRSLYYGEGAIIAEWNGHKHEPLPTNNNWVYLVQYTAGAEGWNCITTDTIVFYSQSYSYKTMIQAAGRIDRVNTPYTDLYYYHFKTRSGIDLAIANALKNKRDFNENKYLKW